MSFHKNTIDDVAITFSVDDHIYLLYKTSDGFRVEYKNKYRILSLRAEKSGNSRDGDADMLYATLIDTETRRIQNNILLRYESVMMRIRYDYAVHVITGIRADAEPSTARITLHGE